MVEATTPANDENAGARAPDTSGPQPEVVPEQALDKLLAEAEAKIEQQRDAWLRAVADAENARKRFQIELANTQKYAIERVAESLLPVADSLEATLGAGNASLESLKSGVELTLKQLRSALEKAKVTEINPAIGEKFDPHRHQAISTVETDAQPNTVVNVLQKGWSLHERVIRPAMVIVAKAKAIEAPGDNG
ncbi:MAG: nucleotide exchange factor GrpE [Betaproteobacteria bacterium]|nr:nucleotide exchange factor GrpE [Betaproteobacteria bacterium]